LFHEKNYRNPIDVSQISGTYTIIRPEIQLASIVKASTQGNVTGNAAIGGWKKYCMVVEYNASQICFNKCIKIIN
jgi:hypothetical protein